MTEKENVEFVRDNIVRIFEEKYKNDPKIFISGLISAIADIAYTSKHADEAMDGCATIMLLMSRDSSFKKQVVDQISSLAGNKDLGLATEMVSRIFTTLACLSENQLKLHPMAMLTALMTFTDHYSRAKGISEHLHAFAKSLDVKYTHQTEAASEMANNIINKAMAK